MEQGFYAEKESLNSIHSKELKQLEQQLTDRSKAELAEKEREFTASMDRVRQELRDSLSKEHSDDLKELRNELNAKFQEEKRLITEGHNKELQRLEEQMKEKTRVRGGPQGLMA